MKRNKLFSKAVLTVLIFASIVGQTQTPIYAKSTTQKENAAYRNVLLNVLKGTNGYYYPSFAQADVDGDGRGEVLISYCGDASGATAAYSGYLLNYDGGKLVKSAFYGFGDAYCNGYLVSDYHSPIGGLGTLYYEITKQGKLKLRAEFLEHIDGDIYRINDKDTTRANYEKYLRNKKIDKNQKTLNYINLTKSAVDKAFPVNNSTSSKSEKAKAAFQAYIKKGSYKTDGSAGDNLQEYAFVDLNNDGITEMLTREPVITDNVYAYVNGKVKLVGRMDHGAYPSAYYCAKKGYISESYYMSKVYYYFNGKSLKVKAERSFDDYRVDGKKTTAKKYAATEKKLTEGLTYEDISDLNWISL